MNGEGATDTGGGPTGPLVAITGLPGAIIRGENPPGLASSDGLNFGMFAVFRGADLNGVGGGAGVSGGGAYFDIAGRP